MGSNRFRIDMPRYVDLYLDGRLKLDELVSAPHHPRRGQRRLRRDEDRRGRPLRHHLRPVVVLLSSFDDYPIHQTPSRSRSRRPATATSTTATSSTATRATATLFFAAALGVYPNRARDRRRVQRGARRRAAISVLASRRAADRAPRPRVGPITVEVRRAAADAAPARRRATTHGVEADLTFTRAHRRRSRSRASRCAPGARVVMDSTRLTQFGTLGGLGRGRRRAHRLSTRDGARRRDRSWGIRTVGEPATPARPSRLPQFFWLWAPLNFDDVAVHFDVNEDGDGRRWHANGDARAVGRRRPRSRTASRRRRVDWHDRVAVGHAPAERAVSTLAPTARHGRSSSSRSSPSRCCGLGYFEPEWVARHVEGRARGRRRRVDARRPRPARAAHIHVQQLCRARMGQRKVLGVLEQLAFGPHAVGLHRHHRRLRRLTTAGERATCQPASGNRCGPGGGPSRPSR